MGTTRAAHWVVLIAFVVCAQLWLAQQGRAQPPRAVFAPPAAGPVTAAAALAPPVPIAAPAPETPAAPSLELATAQPGGGTMTEDRMRELESANRLLFKEVRDLQKRYGKLQQQIRKTAAEEGAAAAPESFAGSFLRPIRKSTEPPEEAEPERGPYVPDMKAVTRYIKSDFSNGLRWYTADDFFDLTFHNLTQVDYRDFRPDGDPLHDEFFIPRQRWYFEGKISDWANYYTVVNRGYGSIDILDAWADINFEQTNMQLRVGRMKTPFGYEYIKIAENDLIAPERSLFIGNFSTNREIGAMLHGVLLDARFEYAAGLFNGPRHSFQDYNNGQDMIFFANTRPWLREDNLPWLQNLNLCGAFVYGTQRNPLTPNALRTANDLTTNEAAANNSPTFLAFNPNVFENGTHMQWTGELAYFYGSFGMLSGVQGGYENLAKAASVIVPESITQGITSFADTQSPFHTPVFLSGWNVTAFYFLTGEQITRRRNLLEPINPIGMHGGFYGFGAVELFARVSELQLSNNVFSDGFADPHFWTNRCTTMDIGFNWYLNHYIKFTFDWQHSWYGNPVLVDVVHDTYTQHQDIFWFRTQIFF
jgi:phosphate-selective porin OprO/OprP